MVKNVNKNLIYLLSTVIFLLIIPSFIAAFAEDEGTIGNNLFWLFFANLFHVLRFPTHTLLWPLIGLGGAITYFGGLILNSIFYGFLIERLIFLIKKINKN
jgi:hypothetical protein